MTHPEDEKAAEDCAKRFDTGPVPQFIKDMDDEKGSLVSAYALGRYRAFFSGIAHERARCAEIIRNDRRLGAVDKFDLCAAIKKGTP